MNTSENYRTEVTPYEQAPWAPHLPGCYFRWAWRVLNCDGSVHVSGVSNGSAEEAQAQAEHAAHRRFANNHGILIARTPIIKTPRTRGSARVNAKSTGDGSLPTLSEET